MPNYLRLSVLKIDEKTYDDKIARESPTFATYTMLSVIRRIIAQDPDLSLTV